MTVWRTCAVLLFISSGNVFMSLWSLQHGTSNSQMQVWDSAQVSKVTSLLISSSPSIFESHAWSTGSSNSYCVHGYMFLWVRSQMLSVAKSVCDYGLLGLETLEWICFLIFTLWACMPIYPPNTAAPTHLLRNVCIEWHADFLQQMPFNCPFSYHMIEWHWFCYM